MKKFILLTILFFASFLISGCWNYTELNDLALVSGISIDKIDEEYKIGIVVSNAKKSESGAQDDQAQTIVFEGTGKTISEALQNTYMQSTKKIYLSHLAVVVIHEQIGKEGLLSMLDFLQREPTSRKNFYIFIAKDCKAGDVLKTKSPLEAYPTQDIANKIKNVKATQGIITAMTYTDVVRNLIEKGLNPLIPIVTIKGDIKDGQGEDNLKATEPKAVILLDKMAVFKEDKLVGYPSEEESLGINILNRSISNFIVTTKCNGGTSVTDISELNTKTKVSVKDNHPSVSVSIQADASVKENNCNIKLEDVKEIQKLEKEVEKEVKGMIQKALQVSQQKYQSDIFGYGNLVYKKNPHYFNQVESIWDDKVFPSLEVKLDINIKLKTKGSLEGSIKEVQSDKG